MKEGGSEEVPTNAADEPSMKTEHTCCCLGVLVGVSLIAGLKEGGSEEVPTNAADEPSMKTEHTCCCLGVLVGVSLIAALVAVILMKDTTVEVTVLRQVHVLMSHGERTPSERELEMLGAPPSEHVFVPYGAGALTNEGKLLTYEMGALLRKRYNDFLGPYYEAEKSIVIASDTNLSKMTALLIAAGLWPPILNQMWNDSISWQPVPYTYPPRSEDYLLYEENCPRYNQEKQRLLKVYINEGLLVPYRDFFHKIAHMTNTNFSTPQDAYNLNNLFVIQDDIKVANPKWAKHVKRKLMDVARLEYSMMFHNNLLRKLSGGALLQQIITEAIWNTRDVDSPKVLVRIGTPVSVAALLSACVAPPPRLPDPGAALLFELHEKQPSAKGKKDKNDLTHGQRFGFKIYYWDDDSAEPRLMEVPGCNAFCPLDTFSKITKSIVSHDYKKDCELTSA
nr:venom acid phosphatase Acph-1-like isoform X2 [Danaus plexippus plexippus]